MLKIFKNKPSFKGLKLNFGSSKAAKKPAAKSPKFNPMKLAKKGQAVDPLSPEDCIRGFVATDPVECVYDAYEQSELVISAAYKQTFGNVHFMESERLLEAESRLQSGEITVMEFIRQLAKSDLYRTLVFEQNSNLRAIELNFKHLLGRAPESYAEISEHTVRLANEGFDAEIDSYIDSNEYFEAFGTNIVPYYRGFQTQAGRNLAGYTNSFQLMQGTPSSDRSTLASSYQKLDENLLGGLSRVTESLNNVDMAKVQEKFPTPERDKQYVSKYGSKSSAPSSNIYSPEEIIRRAVKRKP
ncbi:MAG: phycobilisome rod-core linker polypeptide [Cyanobacteria bacterium P01_F01_bin.42]